MSTQTPANTLVFLSKFTYASTLIGSIYHNGIKLMDFIANLNYPINEGTYPVSLYMSPRFKRTVLLLDVPHHQGIEVHGADYSNQLRGCMAPGTMDGWRKFPTKSLTKIFAESNSLMYLDKLVKFVRDYQIEFIQVAHSECVKVYLTGRG